MSEQLLSWAPRFDLELNRVRGVDDVDDSPFVALAVDESIVLTVRTGVAREVECLDVLDIAEAVTSRLAGVAKRFAQLEYVAFVFEVAEMVCRAQEERARLSGRAFMPTALRRLSFLLALGLTS